MFQNGRRLRGELVAQNGPPTAQTFSQPRHRPQGERSFTAQPELRDFTSIPGTGEHLKRCPGLGAHNVFRGITMLKSLGYLTALSVSVAIASPAYADIVQVSPSAIQGQNILFNAGTQNAATVIGFTNATPSQSIDIRSGGAILRASGGQASVSGALNTSTQPPNDTINLTEFQLELTDDDATFGDIEFRLFGGNATLATFTLVDNAGTVFTFADQQIVGDGRFGFQAINGQSIASLSFTVNGDGIQEVRQIRVGPAAVVAIPEPATWAMMLGGFGLLGGAVRRRTRVTYVAA